MYRKTPSNTESDAPEQDGIRRHLRRAGDYARKLVERHPLHFLAGMVACILISFALAFTVMRVGSPRSLSALPLPPVNGTVDEISGILGVYGTIRELAEIQREIQDILEKDSLDTSDSVRLIDALQRFEQLQQYTHPQNSKP